MVGIIHKDTVKQFHQKYIDRNHPWTVHWELTYECNLSCIHCYTYNEDKSKYLALPQIEGIAKQLKDMGTVFIILSGGEPFIRDDIMDIIEMMRKDFYLVILTNATRINIKIAKRLKELKVSQIEISLFAIDGEIHDSITGIKGSHANTMHGIHCLNTEGVNVRIKSPLMARNISEYPKLVDYSKRLGVSLTSSPQIIPRLDGSTDTYEHSISDEELEVYYSQWRKNKGEKTETSTNKPPALTEDRDVTCNAGRTICSITPDGCLKPCSSLSVNLGNLVEKSFKELWLEGQNKFLNTIRKSGVSDFSKCSTCEWTAQCLPCPGANWLESGDAFVTSEGYCGIMRGIGNIMVKRKEL